MQAAFKWDGRAWEPVTGYQGDAPDYVPRQHEWLQTVGVLLWRK